MCCKRQQVKVLTQGNTHGGEAPPVGSDAERALLLGSFRLELREAMD